MTEKQKWQPVRVARITAGELSAKARRVQKVQILEKAPLVGGLEVLAGFWVLVASFLLLILAAVSLQSVRQTGPRNSSIAIGAMLLVGLPAGFHLAVAIGMFLKSRWAYYGATGLLILWMLLFPIGTVLGFFGIKMLRRNKPVFGID